MSPNALAKKLLRRIKRESDTEERYQKIEKRIE